MAAADEWDNVDSAFGRLERYRVLHPALAAMRRLVDMIKHDPAFADVHPVVSHASLVLSRAHAKGGVGVAWHEGDVYVVSFIDSPLKFSGRRFVREDDVIRVLCEYLRGKS
ncbi:hypothetical protein HV824_19735 [Myxococcus sp. AM009]|uniref:hypothetical protein n=1 Tax=unclassified Myxococcus TaxID=2648731 RepID=UPI001595E832|nr:MULTISPECIES: hypothetical protein [unclassified Myxococcus]NVJ00341.1 hypothetical protein [Myxococcus sp. AM009]NVJ12776.1 hypothetical protein [Myxococcus sp. AM010]